MGHCGFRVQCMKVLVNPKIRFFSNFRGEMNKNKVCEVFLKRMPRKLNDFDHRSIDTIQLIITSSAYVIIVHNGTETLPYSMK